MAAVTSADSRCLYETSQSTGFKATASCLSADRRICNNLQSFINSSSQTSRVAPSWCSVLLWRPSRWQGPWKSPCQPPCSPQLGPSPPVRGRFLGTSLPWTCLWLRSSSPPLPRAAPQTASLGSRARRRGGGKVSFEQWIQTPGTETNLQSHGWGLWWGGRWWRKEQTARRRQPRAGRGCRWAGEQHPERGVRRTQTAPSHLPPCVEGSSSPRGRPLLCGAQREST